MKRSTLNKLEKAKRLLEDVRVELRIGSINNDGPPTDAQRADYLYSLLIEAAGDMVGTLAVQHPPVQRR